MGDDAGRVGHRCSAETLRDKDGERGSRKEQMNKLLTILMAVAIAIFFTGCASIPTEYEDDRPWDGSAVGRFGDPDSMDADR